MFLGSLGYKVFNYFFQPFFQIDAFYMQGTLADFHFAYIKYHV